MQVIWRRPGIAAHEVIAALDSTGWSEATVKTLLNRLLKKKAVSFRKEGKAYLYTALISEADCQRSETKTFVQRVFSGSVMPMLAHFVQSEQLTEAEIQELKKLLQEKGGSQ